MSRRLDIMFETSQMRVRRITLSWQATPGEVLDSSIPIRPYCNFYLGNNV